MRQDVDGRAKSCHDGRELVATGHPPISALVGAIRKRTGQQWAGPDHDGKNATNVSSAKRRTILLSFDPTHLARPELFWERTMRFGLLDGGELDELRARSVTLNDLSV